MLVDLLPSLRALNGHCGYNFALQKKKATTSKKKGPAPEVNLSFRATATQVMGQITGHLRDVGRLRSEFRTQNDSRKQEDLKRQISDEFDKINSAVSRLDNLFSLVEKDLQRQLLEFEDPEGKDPRNRILADLLRLLRLKFFGQVKAFNSLQADVKATFQEKLARQLRVYQKDLSDNEIKDLRRDSDKMTKFVMVHMYGQRKNLENAASDIDEKVAEIRELEQNMQRLHGMIVGLRRVVQDQNKTLDSISATLGNLEDVVVRTRKELETGKTYHVSAKEVS